MKKKGKVKAMKEINYIKIGDYYFPDLKPPTQKEMNIGKYGRMRLSFLKKHRQIAYTNLVTSGQLAEHLQNVDEEANNLYDRLVEDYKVKRNINEALKEKEQMLWVLEMNNIQHCVDEFIKKLFICKLIFLL